MVVSVTSAENDRDRMSVHVQIQNRKATERRYVFVCCIPCARYSWCVPGGGIFYGDVIRNVSCFEVGFQQESHLLHPQWRQAKGPPFGGPFLNRPWEFLLWESLLDRL